MTESESPPDREPTLRTIAMPGDANFSGDVFGGWVLSQMDLAGGVPAWRRAQGRIATVAVEGMRFHQPIATGDVVSFYAEITRVGTTSITVHIQTWATRRHTDQDVKVTEGTYVFVAIDEQGRPRPVPPAGPDEAP